MIRKHLPTMVKFEGDDEFRTLKRNEWPVGEKRTCYVGLQQRRIRYICRRLKNLKVG